jgi:hypothetical protein
MSIKYQPGKVYLRDRRNGNEYEYEANLAANSNMEPFTPVEATKKDEKVMLATEAEQAAIDAANAKRIADAEEANAQQGVAPARDAVVAAVEEIRADETRVDEGQPATTEARVPAPPARPAAPAAPAKPVAPKPPTKPASTQRRPAKAPTRR